MQQVVTSGQNLLPTGSVVITKVDKVELRVGKINSLGRNVEREAVGPVDLVADDGFSQSSVHADSLDSGIFAPVGPEEPASAGAGIQTHSSWLRDIFANQNQAIGSVLARNFDRVQFAVEPVEIFADPIVGQAFNQVKPGVDDFLRLHSAVQARNLLQLHVRPENCAGVHVRGCRNDIFDDYRNSFESLLFQVSNEDRMAVGDDEEGS